MERLENFKAGFIRENPIFGLYLGCCSALAISTTLNNAIGMGVAVILVTIMSNVIISAKNRTLPAGSELQNPPSDRVPENDSYRRTNASRKTIPHSGTFMEFPAEKGGKLR